jgi:hypothetical protein
MLFDKLCGLAERHLPHLIPTLEQAALFHFPGRPHEFLTAQRDQIDYDQANNFFHLPFPVVALEDHASVCLLMDAEENQSGLKGRRYFVDLIAASNDSENYTSSTLDSMMQPEEAALTKQDILQRFDNPYVVNCGYLEDMHYNPETAQMVSHGVITVSYLLNKKELFGVNDQDDLRDLPGNMVKDILRNPVTAHEELIMLTNPKYFILEDSPAKPPKQKKGSKKIPRSHQRPLFTYLKPADIRQKLGIEHPRQDQTRNSPVPHERRKHLRRLSKESGYKEDKVVPVKACWIGTSEKEVKGRRYRVRLDL